MESWVGRRPVGAMEPFPVVEGAAVSTEAEGEEMGINTPGSMVESAQGSQL
jgi:hypothetical protein